VAENGVIPFVAFVAIAVAFAVAARVFAVMTSVAATGFALVAFNALVAVVVVATTVEEQSVALAVSIGTGQTVQLGQDGLDLKYQ
jgi:hypothetical protein